MSNYHTLKQSQDLKSAMVVYHISIPEGKNQAGIPWSAAIVADNTMRGVSLTSITQTEADALTAGTMIEVVEDVGFSSAVALDDATRLTQIKARFTSLSAEILSQKQIELKPAGLEGDV